MGDHTIESVVRIQGRKIVTGHQRVSSFLSGKRDDGTFYCRNLYTELPNEFQLYSEEYPSMIFDEAKYRE